MHVDPRHWPSADRSARTSSATRRSGSSSSSRRWTSRSAQLPGNIDEKLQGQRELTRDIVAACVAVDKCSGITFWGLTDSDSWLNDAHWGQLRGKGPHYPLLFNGDMQPKPVVAGVLEALEKAPPK